MSNNKDCIWNLNLLKFNFLNNMQNEMLDLSRDAVDNDCSSLLFIERMNKNHAKKMKICGLFDQLISEFKLL